MVTCSRALVQLLGDQKPLGGHLNQNSVSRDTWNRQNYVFPIKTQAIALPVFLHLYLDLLLQQLYFHTEIIEDI